MLRKILFLLGEPRPFLRYQSTSSWNNAAPHRVGNEPAAIVTETSVLARPPRRTGVDAQPSFLFSPLLFSSSSFSSSSFSFLHRLVHSILPLRFAAPRRADSCYVVRCYARSPCHPDALSASLEPFLSYWDSKFLLSSTPIVPRISK